jgi:hypothetical protein
MNLSNWLGNKVRGEAMARDLTGLTKGEEGKHDVPATSRWKHGLLGLLIGVAALAVVIMAFILVLRLVSL